VVRLKGLQLRSKVRALCGAHEARWAGVLCRTFFFLKLWRRQVLVAGADKREAVTCPDEMSGAVCEGDCSYRERTTSGLFVASW
jgi:hypothetical protein